VHLFLRKIRFNKWYPREEYPWLRDGELQADPIGDLATSRGNLSVWCMEDSESNLDRIITALAANCDSLAALDYILFSDEILSRLGIEIERSEATTPDEGVNRWHRDLVRLSAQKLVKLATAIVDNMDNLEPKRVPKNHIRRLISEAVDSGRILKKDLKPSLRKKIYGD
jgi:hypothetical protein